MNKERPALEEDAAALRYLEEVTEKCDEVQRRVLADILTQNAGTEYLNRFGLNGATDIDTFTSKVPVITYEDLKPDIQRIANGDFSPILCAQPISEFYTSSGTSAGQGKLVPATQEEMRRRMWVGSLIMPVMRRYLPDISNGKALNFMFIKDETKTPGGLIAQPFTTSLYKSKEFINRPVDAYTSPNEAILCRDSFQSMYTQMLCGLYDRHNIFRLVSTFASGLLRAIRFLQVNHPDLCHDISTGTLNSKIADPALRACMGKIMRPDTELADFIKEECKEEKLEGIIRRIWPNTKCLETIVTGAMAQYIPTLDYYSGGLPKVSTIYGLSECFFGINLNPLCEPSEVSYTMLPDMGYFEFIPLDDSSSRPVNSANVEVGKEYELVVTTYAGLYRYLVGDVLRVTGFHNSAPNFRFMRRKNVLLSIDVDKTDELELRKAVENASTLLQPFNTSIVEYTSYADTKTIPGHYVIYCEMLTNDSTDGPSHEVLDQCCLAMEEALSDIYREGRVAVRSIGPLEIRVVKNGTFEKLMEYAVSRGASVNQYKVPKCVNAMPIVELLDSNVVSAHFSPSMPHWSPERSNAKNH